MIFNELLATPISVHLSAVASKVLTLNALPYNPLRKKRRGFYDNAVIFNWLLATLCVTHGFIWTI